MENEGQHDDKKLSPMETSEYGTIKLAVGSMVMQWVELLHHSSRVSNLSCCLCGILHVLLEAVWVSFWGFRFPSNSQKHSSTIKKILTEYTLVPCEELRCISIGCFHSANIIWQFFFFQTPHTYSSSFRIKPRTLVLWAGNITHCTIMRHMSIIAYTWIDHTHST